MRREIIAIFSLAFALTYSLWPLNAYATSYDSVQSGDWDTSSTWNPTGVPSSADDATIENSNQIGVSSADGSVSAADVNFASNGTLLMATGTTIAGAITATGAGTAGVGTLTLNGGNIVSRQIGTSTDYLGTINANGAGASTITGAVNAALLNMGPGGGILGLSAASNNITTTAFGTNNDILALNSGAGLNGNITATGAGTTGAGILFLSGTSNTVNGNIGTSTDYLGTIQLGVTPGNNSMTASEITGAVNAAVLIMGVGETGATGSLQLDAATNNITKTAFTINPSDETLLPTLILNTGAGLNGTIITATGAGTTGAGTLTLKGGNTVNEQIGTNVDYLGTINANGAGASAITGFVNTAVLNMGTGGGSLQLNNAVGNSTTTDNITTTSFASNNDTLILGTGVSLSGNITATGATSAGAGTLTLNGGNTVNGQIGTSTDYLGTINAGFNGASEITGAVNAALLNMGTGGGSLQLDTTSHITTTKFNAADTLVLNNANLTGNIDFNNNAGTLTVTNGNSISGTVANSTGTANEGTLTFLGSTVVTGGNIGAAGTKGLLAVNFDGVGASSVLGNDIYATTTTINDSATVTTSGNRTTTGALTLAGTSTLNIGATTLTVNGAYTQGSNTVLDLTANSSSSFGKIISTVAASVASGSIVNITSEGYIPRNTILTIINTEGAGMTPGSAAPTTITSTNPLVNFSSSILNGNLILTTSLTPTALNVMGPIVDGGVIKNSYAMLDNFSGVSLDRIQNVLTRTNIIDAALDKTEEALTRGVSSGDTRELNGIWAKPYGSYLNQGTVQGIHGYDAWNAGTGIGLDRRLTDNLIVGVSGGYAYGRVFAEANNASTDITSAQGAIYAGYQDPDLSYYIDAVGSFAWNWYDAKRDINAGSINNTADANYDGQQYGTYIEGGYKINLGNSLEFIGNDLEFRPLASLRWNHLSLAGYTETNADALDLNVDGQSYDLLESGLGASLTQPEKYSWGMCTAEFHAKWLYDFIDDQMSVVSTLTGGGGSFTSNGVRSPKNGLNLGGKLSLDFSNDLSLIGGFDTELRDKFFGISGSGTVRYKF